MRVAARILMTIAEAMAVIYGLPLAAQRSIWVWWGMALVFMGFVDGYFIERK